MRCSGTGNGNGAPSHGGDGGGDRRVWQADRDSMVTQRRDPADKDVEQESVGSYVDDLSPKLQGHGRFDGHRGPGYGDGRRINGGGSFDGDGHGGTGRATSTRCPPPLAVRMACVSSWFWYCECVQPRRGVTHCAVE